MFYVQLLFTQKWKLAVNHDEHGNARRLLIGERSFSWIYCTIFNCGLFPHFSFFCAHKNLIANLSPHKPNSYICWQVCIDTFKILQCFVTSLVKIYSASTAGNHIGVFLTSVLLFPSKLSYLLRKTIDTLTLAASIVVHFHHCHPHKLVVGKHPRLASFMHKTLSLSTVSERNRRLTFKRMFWMVASWSETQMLKQNIRRHCWNIIS